MRRVVVLLVLAALPACGASDAVRTAAEQPVRGLQGSAVADVPPGPEEPAGAASPTPSPAGPSTPPASNPPLPSVAAAPASPEPLHECWALPPPVASDVELALELPPRVRAGTVGVLRLTNRGEQPVQVSGDPYAAAVVVRGRTALTTGASPAIAHAPVTLQPGHEHDVQVRLATATCGPDGAYSEQQLPAGTYDVVAPFVVGSDLVTSAPVRIAYEP